MVPENPVVPVALELAPEEVREPETVQVEGVPELEREAVPPRIRSATAARHRGQAAVPRRVEDLAAAAAETTPAPAATGAEKVWAAAE